MMSQITSHEEQIAEYTDRIAAMEEELKKVWQSLTPSGAGLLPDVPDLVCYIVNLEAAIDPHTLSTSAGDGAVCRQ